MSMNETPVANRTHIGIFGRRNAGKSSLINAISNQQIAVVSEVPGTTTDPVYKTMELLPLGAVVLIDTPGLDDSGALGEIRIKKTNQVINKTDIALVVIDSEAGKTTFEESLIKRLEDKEIPYITVYNKADKGAVENLKETELLVSAKTGKNINELKEMLAVFFKPAKPKFPIIADLISENDTVVLVVPIDEAAPKGRIILPQQQTLREILDKKAMAYFCQPSQLENLLSSLNAPPKMVVTDSQAFAEVSRALPKEILLTSFSILFARHKGELFEQLDGARAVDTLKNGDKVLISEGCTHHRQCNDIGTVKIPRLVENYTKAKLDFEFTSGGEFPEDLSMYKLIIHCGGCTLNEREMKYRIKTAKDQGIPITNYGMTIAKVTGILDQSLEVFK